VTPAVILAQPPEESKGQNDVPQLPYRDGQSRFLRAEQGPAVQMHPMRKAVL